MKECFRVTNSGASQAELGELVLQLGHGLPHAYLSFLQETDGAEWCVHDVNGDCLNLWKSSWLSEANLGYQIQPWIPGLFAIGSDGGSNAILLDRTASSDPNLWPIFRVGFGNLDREDFVLVETNFKQWAKQEFRLPVHP